MLFVLKLLVFVGVIFGFFILFGHSGLGKGLRKDIGAPKLIRKERLTLVVFLFSVCMRVIF